MGSDAPEEPGGSAPCLAHQLDEAGRPLDPVLARDVARWRRARRAELLGQRRALGAGERAAATAAILERVESLLPAGCLLSAYWPIQGEPDLRPWLGRLAGRGVELALPVANTLGHPLTFRRWHPGAAMEPGRWNIPQPADAREVDPTHLIAPVVGFDGANFRLGYGGGFFDRTLAARTPRPVSIGIGFAVARLDTIFPLPHDIPMDWIVTEQAITPRRGA